jgi:hypothetical protein
MVWPRPSWGWGAEEGWTGAGRSHSRRAYWENQGACSLVPNAHAAACRAIDMKPDDGGSALHNSSTDQGGGKRRAGIVAYPSNHLA